MLTVLALALALSMDAFAAALCQGVRRPGPRQALAVGAAFGTAQGVMPLIGWGLGVAFAAAIRDFDHWIAFALLGFLGARMIREGLSREDGDCAPTLSGWALLGAAVATSIDAAAAGITLPLLGQPVLVACLVIGLATAAISTAGVHLGGFVGSRSGRWAEIVGGGVLLILGTKILIEHQFLGG